MNSTNSTNPITREAPGLPELPDIDISGKATWWLAWVGCVLIVRFLMVERKLDGARFGIIGCITGAIGRLGDGDDSEWAKLYHSLQNNNTATRSPDTANTGATSTRATSAQQNGYTVGNAHIGMWQLRLRKKLWIRWIVDLFSWHRMYWFGPPAQGHESNPPQSRRRLGTARQRYGDSHTIGVIAPSNDQLILLYGTQSRVIAEGSGRPDDFSKDKRWKVQRYAFYFLLFGCGLSIRSM